MLQIQGTNAKGLISMVDVALTSPTQVVGSGQNILPLDEDVLVKVVGSVQNWINLSANGLPPVGSSGGNDGASITAALLAASAGSTPSSVGFVTLLPQTYTLTTPIDFTGVSNVRLIGQPGTILRGAMAATGGAANSIIKTTHVLSGVGNTTLNGTPTAGDNVLTVTAIGPIVADTFIKVTAAASGSLTTIYRVVSVAGAVITVDRPVLMPFVNLDTVQPLTSLSQNIFVEGNGMLITGTGDLAIDFIGARNCRVQDVRVDTSGGALADGLYLDFACVFCEFLRCSIDGSTAGADVFVFGLRWASAERCRITQCRASRINGAGFGFSDGYACRALQCDAFSINTAASSGVLATGVGVATTLGNSLCVFDQVTVTDCLTGFSLGYNNNTEWISCAARTCTTTGLAMGVAVVSSDNSFIRWSIAACASGIVLGVNAVRPSFNDLHTSGMTSYPVDASVPSFSIRGWRHVHAAGVASGMCIVRATCLNGKVDDVDATFAAGTGGIVGFFILGAAGSIFKVSRAKIVFAAANDTAFSLSNAGAVLQISDIDVTGAFGGTIGFVGAATTVLRRYGRVDFTICATPYTVAQSDTGTIVANGAGTPQVVAYTDIRAAGYVGLNIITPGGAPTTVITRTIIATTSFTLTFAAGDTSTYQYKVMD